MHQTRYFLVITILVSSLLLFYQNCQRGGSTFSGLGSTDCVSAMDCPDNSGQPNEELIQVEIADGGYGQLDIASTADTLRVRGSCSRGGFSSANVEARLKKDAMNFMIANTACSAGSWEVNFSGLQAKFAPYIGLQLTLDASIIAYDSQGEAHFPANSSLGRDTSTVTFVDQTGPTPPPQPSPSPSPRQTISIASIERSASTTPKKLIIHTLMYPMPTAPVTVTLTYQRSGGTVKTKQYPNVLPDTLHRYAVSINGGDEPTITDPTKYNYAISVSLSTGANDNNVNYVAPNPSAAPYPKIAANSAECLFTAVPPYNMSNTIRFPILFSSGSGATTMQYEYRDLESGSDWRNRSTSVTIAGNQYGDLFHTADGYESAPQSKLLLFRFWYQSTFVTLVTNPRQGDNHMCAP